MEGSSHFEKNDKFLSELTKEEQEAERDKMQELVNMMRAKLNVDQNGAIKGKEINGMPVYPTQKQYEEALFEIERLKTRVDRENIDEKLISGLHKIILRGGKKIAEFLATDFKKQKRGIEETIKGIIENDPELELETLKKLGDDYGQKEIEIKKTRDAERAEELEYKDFE